MDDIKMGTILQTESCNIQDKINIALDDLLKEIEISLQSGDFNTVKIQLFYNNLISAKQEEKEFMNNFNLYKWGSGKNAR